MSHFAEFEIIRLTEDIWLSTLNLGTHPCAESEPAPARNSVSHPAAFTSS